MKDVVIMTTSQTNFNNLLDTSFRIRKKNQPDKLFFKNKLLASEHKLTTEINPSTFLDTKIT